MFGDRLVAPEAILQANATMIVGILFVITIFQIKAKARVGTGLYLFCLAGVIPFSLSSVALLIDNVDSAIILSGFGFGMFALMLLMWTSLWYRKEHESKKRVSQSTQASKAPAQS